MQFHDKDSVMQFWPHVTGTQLIKSVMLLAYILYCLKKHMFRGCVYFKVLGGMIFKSASISLEASGSTCSSLCPDQESQRTSEFVDKFGFKTDRNKRYGHTAHTFSRLMLKVVI